MPLRKGRSNKTRSANIKEMVDSWKRTGRIGNSKPKSKRKAIRQAVAASYTQQRRSGRRSRRK